MMLSLVPSFKLAEQKTELIFLVDRSGSMDGQGIEQAKQALKVLQFAFVFFKKKLPIVTFFKIIYSFFFIPCLLIAM